MLMDALRSSRIKRKESLCHCHTVKTSYVSLFTTVKNHTDVYSNTPQNLYKDFITFVESERSVIFGIYSVALKKVLWYLKVKGHNL